MIFSEVQMFILDALSAALPAAPLNWQDVTDGEMN